MIARTRLFAIGDVHGHPKTLKALVDQLDLREADRLVMIGDYIDRGPDSRRTIDLILFLRRKGIDVVTLMGNHEDMAMSFLNQLGIEVFFENEFLKPFCRSPRSFLIADNGGLATLRQYELEESVKGKGWYEIPEDHLRFFSELKPYYVDDRGAGPIVFVHACFSTEALLKKTVQEAIDQSLSELSLPKPCALLWERSTLDIDPNFDGLIVHGHTTPQSAVREYVSMDAINRNNLSPFQVKLCQIALHKKPIILARKLNLEMGICCNGLLTAVEFLDSSDEFKVFQQKNLDR